ncbi:MAG: sulfatase-like hydrolase/transferase [bacterium]|nr:sulfatase-like hydrolase/transferase [bacterium]
MSIGILVLAAGCEKAPDSSAPEPRTGAGPAREVDDPTVILIVVDSARRDHLTPYGYELETTPNIGGIARDGVVFDDCITPCTGTNAGLASLLTGELASDHGVGSLKEVGRQRLAARLETLPERFAAHGFATFAAVALPQLGPLSGLDQGFDEYRAPRPNEGPRDARQVFFDARPKLSERLGADGAVFAMLHFADARERDAAPAPAGTRFIERHLRPHVAGKAELAQILDKLEDDPDGTARELATTLGRARGSDAYLALGAALYDGRLAFVDEIVGELVALLAEHGRLEDAWIAVVSTRGAVLTPPRATGGPSFLPELARVPLIVRGPRSVAMNAADLVQSHDIMATLAATYELGAAGATSLDLAGGGVRELALCEDASFVRRACFGRAYFVEDGSSRGAAVFERSGSFVPRPADLEGDAAAEVARLQEELAGWSRPWARWSFTTGAETAAKVRWRVLDGYTRSAAVGGQPVAGVRPNALLGEATLATSEELELFTSRRDAPARLTLEAEGLDESRVWMGARPLSELMVPRVPAGDEAWPAQAEDAPAPAVDLQRRSGSWWKLRVGAPDSGVTGAVEVLFAVCPPPTRRGDEVEWSRGGTVTDAWVPGRTDAVRLSGQAPFEVELQVKPKQDLALAVAIDGRVVAAHEIRIGERRFAPKGRIDLYVPDWVEGVTEFLAEPGADSGAEPGADSGPAANALVVRRGVPGDQRAPSPAELELLRELAGDE